MPWLGLVEFEDCAIFYKFTWSIQDGLGLVEFEDCAILIRIAASRIKCWGL